MPKAKDKGLTRSSSQAELVKELESTRVSLRELEQKKIHGSLKNTAARRKLKRQQARLLTWLRESITAEVT